VGVPEQHGMYSRTERPAAAEILKDLGGQARLTVYVGFAPGVGKTYRLITEARQLQQSGKRVMLGWIETKDRSELEQLSEGIPRLPPRMVPMSGSSFPEFDYEAAIAAHPDGIILDELAHTNLPGSVHAKRWQDALALRDAGISVVGAFNVAHLDTVAPTAESLIGFPIREIVPLTFLKAADQVIAMDIAPEQLEARLHAGAIVRKEDINRALQGPFRPQTLRALREMMLRLIDDLTEPALPAARISTAVAVLLPGVDGEGFIERVAAFADAFNLALDIASAPNVDREAVVRLSHAHGAQVVVLPQSDFVRPKLADFNASFVAVPKGAMATALVASPIDRDVLIVGPDLRASDRTSAGDFGQHPYSRTAGDRLRVGYGRLTVYLGAAAGCGKTYAMLDQSHQLKAEGVDVVVGFVETHGRADTARKLEGLEIVPRLEFNANGVRYSELDVPALLARRPQIALIDELAHTNAPGSKFQKRYEDVLSVLRSGISVLTTLNVQHLEGLNDVVRRLTGVTVRETMPDGILELADDVVLIDASAQTLRDRLRAGKIYPKERIEAALGSFFRIENLAALRELALREALRTRAARRRNSVSEIFLGVAARERDTILIQRAARLAKRLNADFSVIHVARSQAVSRSPEIETLRETTRTVQGSWILTIDDNPAKALVRIAAQRPGSTLAIEGVRTKIRWLGPKSFAQQLLESGAQELLVFVPVATTG
jgi:two-component system sensor histidine kinase KdpD